jgi:hypothetical protein
VTKVVDLDRAVEDFRSDGNNVYWSALAEVRFLAAGSSTTTTIGSGFGSIIAVDGKDAYIADSKRGAVSKVADAAGTPAKPRELAEVKGIQSLLISGATLYVGSNVIENEKAAGIIGAISL